MKGKPKTGQNIPNFKLLAVTILLLSTLSIQKGFKTYQLYEDRDYTLKAKFRVVKTVKITLADEIITVLESDEKRFFWEATSQEMARITLSPVPKPTEDDPVIQSDIGEGKRVFTQFSKYLNKDLFSAIKN
jgi:hypothetical protein